LPRIVVTITAHGDGWLLRVRAQPGARKNAVLGEHAGALKLAVTAPPQAGRANEALVELLCAVLHVKRSQVELCRGATGRDKLFLIRNLPAEDLQARVAALLA
jgi:uncharacterized protein (TIGR00251 family)